MTTKLFFYILPVTVWLLPESPLFGQSKQIRPYHAQVIRTDDSPDAHGILYDVNDSSVVLATTLSINEIESHEPGQVILYNEIETIRLSRKGKVWRSALTGIAIGAATGAIIGFAAGSGDFLSPGETAGATSVGGAIAGGLIGVLVGIAKIRIPIDGDAVNFANSQQKLIECSYQRGLRL